MSIFKGRLAAREGSYFKKEDEQKAEQWRKRRLQEGVDLDAHATAGPVRAADATPERLAEISAQETRLSAPVAAHRRRATSMMPPISSEGAVRHRLGSWAAAGAVGAIPATRLGRDRWALELRTAPVELLPEELRAMELKHAAQSRAAAAAVRSAAYGCGVAVVGVTALVVALLNYYDIGSVVELRASVQGAVDADAVRARLEPFKGWLRRRAEANGLASADGGPGLVARVSAARKGAVDPAAAAAEEDELLRTLRHRLGAGRSA